MKSLFILIQILVSSLIVVLVLVQSKGTGFGRSLSGATFARRGLEKVVFRLTFVLVFIFIAISVSLLFV